MQGLVAFQGLGDLYLFCGRVGYGLLIYLVLLMDVIQFYIYSNQVW